jgi:FAD/FMN-containing dehydrogenase
MSWIDELQVRLGDRLVLPDDERYEAMRIVAAGNFDKQPAAIARVADAADVAAVINIARDNGIEIAIRSGGHDGAGHSTTDGGVVIDVRDMKKLEIDADARSAWAETGLAAGEVVSALAERDLVIGFGDTGSVGIGGITLGGGIGYMARKHGMTIDNLLAAEIVTADGQLLQVDASSHPDLFWAIRGGGGNFGVATRFQYRVFPAESFVGGILVLPASAEVVSGFIAAAHSAPEELTTIANVMNCPPMPFVPAEHHGQVVVLAMIAFTGDQAEGEAAMAPFRALATPIADLLRPMRYAEMFPPEEDDSYRPLIVGHTMFMSGLDLAGAGRIVDALNASDAPMRAVQLRVLGGAMARVPIDATAFAHRQRQILAMVVSFCEGPDDRPRRAAWVGDLAAALDDGTPGAYVNFLEDEGPERVRQAYPGETGERLARIKRRYDPGNLFRLNQNIVPS